MPRAKGHEHARQGGHGHGHHGEHEHPHQGGHGHAHDGAHAEARGDRHGHAHEGGHGHEHEGGHGHDHHHAGEHGNPADLEDFLARMEAPERAEWQKPDEVVAKLALALGTAVCEVGAGPGYFTLRLARAVGPGGVVYAVDVEPLILAALRDRLVKSGVGNVVPVLGLDDDPLVPPRSCDLVLLVNVLHHLADPVAFLRRLQRTLRPGGRIVDIDLHKRETPVGPPVASRIDRADLVALAAEAGLEVGAEHDFLPYQYFLELRPR